MYKRSPVMCTQIASNLTSGYLKKSLLECCNVTELGVSEIPPNDQDDKRCPDGFSYNPQGRYVRSAKYD